MRPSARRTRGMSLVEVAISISLLALLIFPLYSLLFSSRVATTESRQLTIARLGMEHQLERLRTIANTGDGIGFANLAGWLVANPTFDVPGLPRWVNRSWTTDTRNGRIRVCLDETARYFTNSDPAPHDDYFATPPFDSIVYPACLDPDGPPPGGVNAVHMNLDASFDLTTTPPTPQFTALATTSNYRVLPVRLELYWGGGPPGGPGGTLDDRAPKLVMHAVIAPKTNFRRG